MRCGRAGQVQLSPTLLPVTASIVMRIQRSERLRLGGVSYKERDGRVLIGRAVHSVDDPPHRVVVRDGPAPLVMFQSQPCSHIYAVRIRP